MGGLRDCLLVVWHRKWRYFGCQVTFFVKKGSGSLVGPGTQGGWPNYC